MSGLNACLNPASEPGKNRKSPFAGQSIDTTWINHTMSRIMKHEIAQPDSIFSLLDSIIQIGETSGNDAIRAIAAYEAAVNHYDLNNYQSAKDYFNRAIKYAREASDTLTWAKSLQESGSLALTLGDDHLCLKLNYEALPLFEKAGQSEGIAKVYNILGLYKFGQKEYDSAISYFNRAMELNLKVGNRKGYIHNRGNLAYLYERIGELTQAEEIYLELENELTGSSDSLSLQVIYADLSSLNRKKGEPLKALSYSKKAVQIAGNIRDTAGLAGNYGDLGEMFLVNHLPDSASYYFNKAILCSRVVDDPEIEIAAINFLLITDSIQGMNYNIPERYKRILELKDLVFKRKYENHLKVSELTYENHKKSMLIEIQNLNLQIAKKQKQLLLFLLILAVLFILLSSLIIVFYIKNIHKKKNLLKDQLIIKDLEIENASRKEEINKLKIEKIENSLKLKELEQVSHSLAMEQKNELLGLIHSKLKSALEAKGSLDIKEINTIMSSIRLQITDNNESDLFNQKFSQVHPAFYNNLSSAHPDLTRSELKFCAYLKLNLSTHQIINIMNVTSEAIRKNRYRIRKKLKLSAEESLEGYLAGF